MIEMTCDGNVTGMKFPSGRIRNRGIKKIAPSQGGRREMSRTAAEAERISGNLARAGEVASHRCASCYCPSSGQAQESRCRSTRPQRWKRHTAEPDVGATLEDGPQHGSDAVDQEGKVSALHCANGA